MKPIRWTPHALRNLVEREIDRNEADETLARLELAVASPPIRQVLMRRYFDHLLQQKMLLRVVIEETESEVVVVTLFKTSQIQRYLRG